MTAFAVGPPFPSRPAMVSIAARHVYGWAAPAIQAASWAPHARRKRRVPIGLSSLGTLRPSGQSFEDQWNFGMNVTDDIRNRVIR
jgi:hypothetical protein